ncbi:MAG: hypothetical protein ACRDDY_07945 [Clostridium sp.]|uniref:hypothetical protein n=1 Tax=Clostridium sp. TaxID=1506 RepID=UPI003EE7D85D
MKNINISDEDFKFLKELQHEMITQDHVGQASPRFWVVKQPEKEYWVEENVEGIFIYDSGSCESLFEGNFESEEFNKWFIDYVNEEYSDIEWNEEELNKGYLEFTIYDEEYFIYDVEDLKNFFEDKDYISIGYYRTNHVIKENTMFLTLREAREHLESNSHHYNDKVYTYAMTAWRSPQVAKLYEVLEGLELEDELNG